jgi:hypothetical protein
VEPNTLDRMSGRSGAAAVLGRVTRDRLRLNDKWRSSRMSQRAPGRRGRQLCDRRECPAVGLLPVCVWAPRQSRSPPCLGILSRCPGARRNQHPRRPCRGRVVFECKAVIRAPLRAAAPRLPPAGP